MKKVKLIAAVALLLAVVICTSGCIIIPIYSRHKVDPEEVSSIYIYDFYRRECMDAWSTEAEWSEVTYYTVDEAKHEEFCRDLRDIQFKDYIIIVLAAIDPSFYYGEYVVRVNYNDGGFEYISCSGYGEEFDAEGNSVGADHAGCDDEEWTEFIYKYIGRPEGLIHDYGDEIRMLPEDTARMAEIFEGMVLLDYDPGCRFSGSEYIEIRGKNYYPAKKNNPYVRVDDKYYSITPEERDELYRIIREYVSGWRYGSLTIDE